MLAAVTATNSKINAVFTTARLGLTRRSSAATSGSAHGGGLKDSSHVKAE